MKEVTRRVKQGAKFLDLVAPGWEGRIDRKDLLLESATDCICGQVFSPHERGEDPDFSQSGYVWAGNNLFTEGNRWVKAVLKDVTADDLEWNPDHIPQQLGFTEDWDRLDIGFAELQEAWFKLLAKRDKKRATELLQKSKKESK